MASSQQLGVGWRCVKSEDFGQTFIYDSMLACGHTCRPACRHAQPVTLIPGAVAEPALPANSPTPGALATPWGPSYPMSMAEAMSQESAMRNRAIMEETANSCHFESTFFMSPLGGDGYGKATRNIPSTVTPGPPAPPLGTTLEAPKQRTVSQQVALVPSQQQFLLAGSGGSQQSPPGTFMVQNTNGYGSVHLSNASPGLSLAVSSGGQVVGLVGGQGLPVQRQSFGLVSSAPLATSNPQTTLLSVTPPQQQVSSLQDQLLALQARHSRAVEQQVAASRYI